MKCPGCGGEMPPESLFCEKCGYEIHIVPDYDPLDEVSLGGDGNSEEKPEKKSQETKEVSEVSEQKKQFPYSRILLIAAASAVAVLILVGIFSKKDSGEDYSYQLSEGMSLYEEGSYADAAAYLAKALALQGGTGDEGIELLETLAYTYAYTGENEAALDCIKEAIDTAYDEGFDIDGIYDIYKIYMDILNITGQTGLINDIVAGCEDQELMLLLYDYRISAPTCSEEGGTYSYYVRLELEAEYGNIYYTLDGSDPADGGTLYGGSFALMEEGYITLRAVAVNKKGMVSPELSADFILKFGGGGTDDNAEY